MHVWFPREGASLCHGSLAALSQSVTLMGYQLLTLSCLLPFSQWFAALVRASTNQEGVSLETQGSYISMFREQRGEVELVICQIENHRTPHKFRFSCLPTQRVWQQRATFFIALINSDPNLSVWGSASSPSTASIPLTDSPALLPPLYQGNLGWGRDPGSSNWCHWCKSLLYKLLKPPAHLVFAKCELWTQRGGILSFQNRFGTNQSSEVYNKEPLET